MLVEWFNTHLFQTIRPRIHRIVSISIRPNHQMINYNSEYKSKLIRHAHNRTSNDFQLVVVVILF